MLSKCIPAILIIASVPMLLSGCSTGQASAGGNSSGSKFALSARPDGALTIQQAKQALEASDTIVVAGTIDAGAIDPFEPGKARFVIKSSADPKEPVDHGGPGHDPSTCPYCKNNQPDLNETIANVQFLDESGTVIAQDARELLRLSKGQTIVVQGTGTVDDLGFLTIDASGVYVQM